MIKRISNVVLIFLLYFVVFIKYSFFSESFFDIQFVMPSLLMISILFINLFSSKLNDNAKDIGKFLCHILFVLICFTLLCSFISLLNNIFFYFGFVNTIIVINAICLFFISGFTKFFKQTMMQHLSKSMTGTKILEFLNYYYNAYILSKKCCEKMITCLNNLLQRYVWVFIKTTYYKFVKINSELCDNEQSNHIKNNFDEKYLGTKCYIIEKYLQPYFIKSFKDALKNDPFTIMNSKIKSDPFLYKNNLTNQNINMNLLENIKINQNNVDDLDDDLDDNSDNIVENKSDIKIQQRAILKKKLIEKKNKRTNSQRQNSINIADMNSMLKTMTTDNNFEKLLKQISPDELNAQMNNIDINQIQQLFQVINKKK